jgi:hypothetical protein
MATINDVARVKKKSYRNAVRRIIKGVSKPGDRDKMGTAVRFFLKENPKTAERLLEWMKPDAS